MWRMPQEKADKGFLFVAKKAVQVTGSLFGFERSLSEHSATATLAGPFRAGYGIRVSTSVS